MNNIQYINECIRKDKEFEFIKQVSDFYNISFYKLCDFALDNYNYQRRNSLDNRGAKFLSLSNTADYAYSERSHIDETKKTIDNYINEGDDCE